MTDASTHPADDELVLLFYGELPDEEQGRLRHHVETCADCRVAYNALTRTLHLAGTFQATDPGPDFEARVWSRLAPELTTTPPLSSRTWLLLAAAAAFVLAAGAGRMWTPGTTPATPPASVADVSPVSDPRERVLFAAIDAHLVQTEMVFVELLNAPANEPDAFTYVQSAAGDLVASGRLYRETARDTGASQLVAVLDELEPVLVEVARSGEATTAGDIRALRGRIEQDALLFKVRAVAADIQDRQDGVPSGEGAL